jgi:hypothetical protein
LLRNVYVLKSFQEQHSDLLMEYKVKYSYRLLTIMVIAMVGLFTNNPTIGQEIQMELPEINRQAASILLVRAESAESHWVYGTEGNNIVTTTRFRVLESIRGDFRQGEPFHMLMTGGTVGAITQEVSSSMAFEIGGESILFLPSTGNYIVGGTQGRYPVINGDVLIENQKIRSVRFREALRQSNDNPNKLPAFLETIRAEAVPAETGNTGSRRLKSGNSVTAVTISSISPDRQSAGTDSEITINGTNFGASQGTGKVEFFYRVNQPKIEGPVVSWSDTRIVCKVPIGTIGGVPASAASGPVTVTSGAGVTSNGYLFRVTFSYGGKKWASDNVAYRINENLSSMTGEGQALQDAANSWSSANSKFRLVFDGTHTNTAVALNGHNDLGWGTMANPAAIGQSSSWSANGIITECDIVLNSVMPWNTSSPSIDIETIALHELGHWLNLRDQYGSYGDGVYDSGKIMYGTTYYNLLKRLVFADEILGIQWIYGMGESISISGYVKTGLDVPVADVVMNGLPGNPLTNTSGYYAADVAIGWTGTVTPSKTGYSFNMASHTYSNQATSLDNQDFTATSISNIATLSDLKTDGNTVAGFSSSTTSYSITLPFGTIAIPVVTATTTDSNATRVITQAASLPGTATVRVTAENGTTVKIYSILFSITSPSSDATLSGLRIDGIPVAGFTPSVFTYQETLPYGTTRVPGITAVANHSLATVVILNATLLPGVSTVQVTAQDGTTRNTYSVTFSLAKNADATLSDLKTDGNTVAGFSISATSYSITLLFGTIAVPVVTATTTDSNATRVITQAASLPGTATVRVTAENGTTVQTYTILFSLTSPSSDATLSGLTVNGVTVANFTGTSLSYEFVLPEGAPTPPVILPTTTDRNATTSIMLPASYPGHAIIRVMAEDQITSVEYDVLIRFPLSGMDDNAVQTRLLVYPNPNAGSFTFEYNSLNNNPVRLSVLDVTGKVVYDHLFARNSLQIKEFIQLTGRRNGMFFIRVIDGEQVSRVKMIVE